MVEHLFSICCEVRGISNNGLSFHLQPYVWALLLIILFGRKVPVSILSPANYAGLEVAVQTVYKNLNPCTTHTRTYAIVLLTFLVFLRVITAPSCYWQCSLKKTTAHVTCIHEEGSDCGPGSCIKAIGKSLQFGSERMMKACVKTDQSLLKELENKPGFELAFTTHSLLK